MQSDNRIEVPVTPSGGKELYYTLLRRLLDASLVALGSISPGKGIYYGTPRCRTLPKAATICFLRQILL